MVASRFSVTQWLYWLVNAIFATRKQIQICLRQKLFATVTTVGESLCNLVLTLTFTTFANVCCSVGYELEKLSCACSEGHGLSDCGLGLNTKGSMQKEYIEEIM